MNLLMILNPQIHTLGKDDFGGASITPAGNLEVVKFIDASRVFFKKTECILEEEFKFDLLDEEAESIVVFKLRKSSFAKGSVQYITLILIIYHSRQLRVRY